MSFAEIVRRLEGAESTEVRSSNLFNDSSYLVARKTAARQKYARERQFLGSFGQISDQQNNLRDRHDLPVTGGNTKDSNQSRKVAQRSHTRNRFASHKASCYHSALKRVKVFESSRCHRSQTWIS